MLQFLRRMAVLAGSVLVWKWFPKTRAAVHNVSGSAYDFTFAGLNGAPLPLSAYRGKLLLIVNTASECGFTPQYMGLQRLWDTYKERGLVVLGVPSNDFAGQEPGDGSAIQAFTAEEYQVTFPLTEKVAVRGEGAHPFYRWIAAQYGASAAPSWNFHKYLIGPDGQLIEWYSPFTAPDAARFVATIEAHLPK